MGDSRLDSYLSIVPAARQTAFQESGFHAFLHYGMNTFTDMEWGDGKASPKNFQPSQQNTDQWVAALQKAGVKGVILTAKHHDGFCLWPTKTTEYCIRNSPYRDGKGDVMQELRVSCDKYGMKLGFYLSPWDRNSEYYGTPEYDDFYVAQLTELLTQYGDIFCVWLDGACGAHMDGKQKQVYDFARYYATIRQLQPNSIISNCGPDIRWVGNEGGYARESEWNVVPEFACDTQVIAESSQQADDPAFRNRTFDVVADDLGSREVLAQYNRFMWYPAEVDVSIRPGWFYHKKEDGRVRSLNNLLHIYYTSVGGNSTLLLNVPPTKEGLLHQNDVKRLAELGAEIRKGVADPVSIAHIETPAAEAGFAKEDLLSDDMACYTPQQEAESYDITLQFARAQKIDKLLLKEQCDYSQRVESYEIYTRLHGKETLAYRGTTIGFCRFALFRKPVQADGVRLRIIGCRSKPYLRQVQVYGAGGMLPRMPWYRPIVLWAHKVNYKVYVKMQERGQKKSNTKES